MVAGVRVRPREQPAEVGPARRIADEQGDVTTVGQRDLRAVDGAQTRRLRRLRELHRAGDRVVVGQRQGGMAALGGGEHELFGLRRPVQEGEGRVAMELHVGHEHMFASRADRKFHPTKKMLLTRIIVGEKVGPVHGVTVIDDPAAAEASLDPIRARLLAELAEPGSASTLAARVGLTRQKANYHLRALEAHGLVELVEERRKGNCTERVLQATAASYVISPTALSAVAPDPSRDPDQRSARWLLAVAGRMVREVGDLITRSSAAGKPVATLGIDSEVRFASAKDRAAFAVELADAVNGLVAKYHDETAPGGRPHRFVVALHPTITNPKEHQP